MSKIEKMVSDDTEITNCLSKYEVRDEFHTNMNSHPTLTAILKYRKHASVVFIIRFCHQALSLNFSCVDKNTVLKETEC